MGTHRLAPGTVLGRYELLLPIAQGGMATVWAARQTGSRGFSKTVAVKTMLPNLSEDPTFEQMFLDEASIASRIHHPNVAEILDLGEQDEVLYLVMEWVDGESLSAVSKQTKKTETEVPLRVALKIVAQACAGLHAAHELKNDDDESVGLVHRDVSPQNILVASSGHVKLVDFGVAKAMGRAGATSVGQLKGKVPYMSPEQTRGNDVDRRTDIFAMGSVLYRITTGFHPFIEDNDIKTMRSIASRPPIRPRVKNPKLPIELEQVILKALEKSADKRFQSAAELEAALDKVIATTGEPVPVDEVGAFVRTTLGERDQKRRAALRDAVNAADEERRGLPRAPVSNRNSDPTVSDLMLTQAATPPSFATGAVELHDDGSEGDSHSGGKRLAETRPDQIVARDPVDETDPPTTARAIDDDEESTRLVDSSALGNKPSDASEMRPESSSFLPASEPRLASSPSLAALTERTGSRSTIQRRLGPLLGGAAALALIAIVTVVLLRKPSNSDAQAAHARDVAAKNAGPPDTSSPGSASSTSVHDAPEPAAVASVPEGGSTFAIDELPDNKDGRARSPSARAPASSASSKAVVAPAGSAAHPGDPAKPADPSKPPAATPTSKPWVPAVQDPGF